MNAKKVIIDCDPGIDDSLALMLAVNLSELDIVGITVVCGNVPACKGAENALKVLEWMERMDIPVYLGEESPLVRDYVDAMDTHGRDGLGESNYLPVTTVQPKQDAVRFMAKTFLQAKETGEKISVIALGPMTNLARLIERDPDSLEGLDELVSMGGSYKSHGNCSPVAEYNYWCDPHAAKKVYEAFEHLPQLAGKQIHMIGLDVTRKIVLTPNLIEYMCRLNPQMGERIRKITRFYLDFHWNQEGIIGCVINDPLAVAYFADRSLCSGFSAYTAIETQGISMGQSVVDRFEFWREKRKNSYILTKTDALRFMILFFKRVIHPDAEESMIAELMGRKWI